MNEIRGKIRKGPRDGKGRIRKLIEVSELYDDQFDFGDIVRIEKVNTDAEQRT